MYSHNLLSEQAVLPEPVMPYDKHTIHESNDMEISCCCLSHTVCLLDQIESHCQGETKADSSLAVFKRAIQGTHEFLTCPASCSSIHETIHLGFALLMLLVEFAHSVRISLDRLATRRDFVPADMCIGTFQAAAGSAECIVVFNSLGFYLVKQLADTMERFKIVIAGSEYYDSFRQRIRTSQHRIGTLIEHWGHD